MSEENLDGNLDAGAVSRAPAELAGWFRTRLAESSSLRWQSDLAHAAHVSPTLVSDLFRGVRPIPEDKVRALATALGAGPAELPSVSQLWRAAKIAWARADLVAKRRGAVQRTGLDSLPIPDPLLRDLLQAQYRARDALPYRLLTERIPPLSKLYVRQDVQRGTSLNASGGSVEQVLKARSARSQPISGALAIHQHVLVIAEPGGGKSTLLYQLAAQAAAWWLEAPDPGKNPQSSPSGMTVPVRVPAQALVGRPLPDAIAASVLSDLAEYMDLPAPPSALFSQPPMPNIDWLVMIDGLDEILDHSMRSKVIDAMASRADQKGSPFRFLVVSRPLPPWELTGFDSEILGRYTLEEFDDYMLASYARTWFETRTPGMADAKTPQFLKLVRKNSLQSVVALPLLATVALIVFEEADGDQPALPSGRSGLYAQFVHYLLHVRQDTVQTRAALTRQLGPYPYGQKMAEWVYDHLVELIEYLASEHISVSPEPLIDLAYTWVKDRFPHPTEAIPDCRRTLSRLLTSTGLLIERAKGLDFLHRSFAEYLAAGLIADQLPDKLSGPEARAFIASALPLDNRSCSLFALGRWYNCKRGRDGRHIVKQLLAGGNDYILLAAEIITFEIRVGSALEDDVSRALFQMARSTRDHWPEPLAALAALPNRRRASDLLYALARNSAHIAIMRVRAARLLAGIGDYQSSIRVLAQIATINLYRHDYMDETLNDDDVFVPTQTQNIMRRWQLGEVERDDLDNNISHIGVYPLSAFVGDKPDADPPDADATSDDRDINDDEASELDIGDDDLLICALAAWELVDLGEVTTAVRLLVKIALEEYRTSQEFSSHLTYVSLPFDFSYWAIESESSQADSVLARIAADATLHPAVRLSAAFVLAYREGSEVALRHLNSLAGDSRIDITLRLQAAQCLSYLGMRKSAERVFAALAGNSMTEIRLRLEACRGLRQFGGRNAVMDAFLRIVSNMDEDPGDRISTALAIFDTGETNAALEVLIQIASDPDMDVDIRMHVCRCLEELERPDLGRKLLRDMVGSKVEWVEVRIAAARELALMGDVETGTSVLMEISGDPEIHSRAQAMALHELRELELG